MSFPISPTGIWLCEDTSPHTFDQPLATTITAYLRIEKCKTIIDFGCGDGSYVKYMRQHEVAAIGVDGNPNTHKWNPYCSVYDISKPQYHHPRADWVMSLETGEHIPREFEQVFLDNLTNNALVGIILSWFPRDGHGIGHVNPRPNEWVRDQLFDRGFDWLHEPTEQLRLSASQWWFKESIQVFRRKS